MEFVRCSLRLILWLELFASVAELFRVTGATTRHLFTRQLGGTTKSWWTFWSATSFSIVALLPVDCREWESSFGEVSYLEAPRG